MSINITTRPLELNADNKSRLKIPLIIRRMLKIKPGAKFYLVLTEHGDLLYSPAEKHK